MNALRVVLSGRAGQVVRSSRAMQLVIKAHAGDSEEKTITLNVQSSDSVDSVKQQIQEKAGTSAVSVAASLRVLWRSPRQHKSDQLER